MPSPVANLCRIDPAVPESPGSPGRLIVSATVMVVPANAGAGALIAKARSSPALLVNNEPKPETRVSDTRFFSPTVPT